MIKNLSKYLLLLCVAGEISGCKLGVIVTEGGDVQSQSGIRSCTGGNVCEFEVTDTTFSDSFTAIPREGYEFSHWIDGLGENFLCGGSTNATCSLTTTVLDGNAGAEAIVASEDLYQIMPRFKFVGIDTDGDGIKDHLDEDDDNDGLTDSEDPCPLNPASFCGHVEVGGIISEDTTWTSEGGPIYLVQKVQIADGVTLTITDGAEIYGSVSNAIQVYGNLLVQGAPDDLVSLNGVVIQRQGISATYSNIEINYAYINESDYLTSGTFAGDYRFVLRNSIIDGGSQGSIGDPARTSYVEFNTFRGSMAPNGYSFADNAIYIRNNTFTNYGNWVLTLGTPGVVVERNSFLSPGVKTIRINPSYSFPVNAPNNYWGTTDTSTIESMIWDANDDLSITATLSYQPILTAPHPDTPTGF